MQVIILAGGKGKRLSPLTDKIPKPLIKIRGQYIIDHIISSLPDEINEIIVIVDHLKEKIIQHLENKRENISFISQGDVRGTYGALLSAKDKIKDRFIVLNSDDLQDTKELKEYIKHERSFGVQRRIMDPQYYSVVIDENGVISGLRKQTKEEEKKGAFVATGVYVLDKDFFKYEPVKLIDGEYGIPQTLIKIAKEYPVKAVITKKWFPVNTFQDLKKLGWKKIKAV